MRQARQGLLGGIPVNRAEAAQVARVEGLQQIECLRAAYLAHDDSIGSVPESGPQQVRDRDGRQRRFMSERHLGPSRFESEQVRLVEMDFRSLLDYNDPIAIRDPRCQGVQQRRLSRSRPSGDEDVAFGGDRSY